MKRQAPAHSIEDDDRLLELAEQVVEDFFAPLEGVKTAPSRSQIQGLYLCSRMEPGAVLEFIQRQLAKAQRRPSGSEAASDWWTRLERQIKGPLTDWCCRDLPPQPQPPAKGSPNMHSLLAEYNRAKKERERLITYRLHARLPLFVRHVAMHYSYRRAMKLIETRLNRRRDLDEGPSVASEAKAGPEV